MFLKDKGDAMHRAGNFRAAVNAYTKALEIDAGLTACYANRAASHLKLQDFRQVTRTRRMKGTHIKYVVCFILQVVFTLTFS